MMFCQKNPFEELSSKKIFLTFKNLQLSRKWEKTKIAGFTLLIMQKIRVKMIYFYPWYVLNHKHDFEFFTVF